MRKELGEIKRHAIPAVTLALACYTLTLLIYTSFEAVRDPSLEEQSPFALIMLVMVILQSLFSIGSHKPWSVLLLTWIFAILAFPTFYGYYSSGPISRREIREQHASQKLLLKGIVSATLPVINALAVQCYFNRRRKMLKANWNPTGIDL